MTPFLPSERLAEMEQEFSRRLIVVSIQPGKEPDVDLEPADGFALWEVKAALARALSLFNIQDEIVMLLCPNCGAEVVADDEDDDDD